MRRTLLVRLPLLASLGLGVGTASGPKTSIWQITLERTRCYGTCPAYTLTLNADGTATYTGTAYVARIGTYRGNFWTRHLERLESVLKQLGSAKWKKAYNAPMTDQSTQIVTIVTDEGKRTIREYGHVGPDSLWSLQTMVDGIGANVSRWEKVSGKE